MQEIDINKRSSLNLQIPKTTPIVKLERVSRSLVKSSLEFALFKILLEHNDAICSEQKRLLALILRVWGLETVSVYPNHHLMAKFRWALSLWRSRYLQKQWFGELEIIIYRFNSFWNVCGYCLKSDESRKKKLRIHYGPSKKSLGAKTSSAF